MPTTLTKIDVDEIKYKRKRKTLILKESLPETVNITKEN